MKIGIIGTGNMGRVLGGLWAQAGHEVFFGARSPQPAEAAAAFGDALLYSPRGIDPAHVVPETQLFDGKIVIDLNNWATT